MQWELTEHERTHYPNLISKKIRMIPHFENEIHAGECKNGFATSCLATDYSTLAVLPYIIGKDVSRWHLLRKSVELEYSLFTRYQKGEKIAGSLRSLLTYKTVFIALAVGDWELAEQYASIQATQGVDEEDHCIPLNLSLGFTLKYLVLQDQTRTAHWLSELKCVIETDEQSYCGLYEALQGIHTQDVDLVNQGLKRLTENYSDMFGDDEMFSQYTEERFLFLWGIGLVKFARHRGLDVHAIEPLIPQALVDYKIPEDVSY